MFQSGVPRGARLRDRRPWALVLVVAFATLQAVGARASDSKLDFNIPAKPLSAGLVDFAVQGHLSISLVDLGPCGSTIRSLTGRFTAETGLHRLLSGSGCGYRQIDARAFAVTTAEVERPATPRVIRLPHPSAPETRELVVVATHRPTPAERLAYSVSSVSGAVLRDQGIRDIGDLALISPALTLTNLGMGRDKVLLRGLSDGPLTGLTQSLVGLYLDDTRLTYNAPDPDLRLVDMERVEVLRGPQGALYGAGSLGGVVHLVPHAPDPDRVALWTGATVSFTESGGTSHTADGIFNLPLLSGRGAARLVVYHEVDGGYLFNKFLQIDDVNSSQRTGGRLTLDFKLDNRWTISTGAVVQHIGSSDTQYTSFSSQPDTRKNRIPEPHNNDFTEYHLGLTGDLGWAKAHASVAYIDHNIFSRYDASLSPPVRVVPRGPAAFDALDTINSVVTEETLISSPERSVQWLAGLFYAHTTQFNHLTLTAETPPPTIQYEEVRHDTRDEGALFGEATVPIYHGLSVTAGGRLFTARDAVTSVNTVFTVFTSAPYAGSVHQTGFAPKVVISDRISPSLLIYVQAAEGYRTPGINTAATPGERLADPGGSEPLRLFKGDSLWSLEAGAKITALDGRLRVGLAGFDIQWKDIQSDQLLPSGIPFTANIGDGRNLGLEFEAALRVAALELRAEMILNDPVLYHANSAFPLLSNIGLGVVPDKSFGLSAHYAWKIWGGRSLNLDGHVTYVGASSLMLNIATSTRMGDYTTGRLAASIVDDHWRLTVAIDNPADVSANTFAYGNPFTIRSTPQSTPLRPRTISLGVEVGF